MKYILIIFVLVISGCENDHEESLHFQDELYKATVIRKLDDSGIDYRQTNGVIYYSVKDHDAVTKIFRASAIDRTDYFIFQNMGLRDEFLRVLIENDIPYKYGNTDSEIMVDQDSYQNASRLYRDTIKSYRHQKIE